MSARFLLITLDSVEPLLVRQWTASGELPHLKRLLETGAALEIENLPGFGNSVFWPSLYTCADPSHHGGYYIRQPKPPRFSLEPFLKADYVMAPFWAKLEESGMQICVIDPIEAPVAKLSRGLEIIDWMIHQGDGTPISYPPERIDDILARYGADPFDGNPDRCVREGMSVQTLMSESIRRLECKTDAVLDLMAERDWDCFIVNFADAHDIGHLGWHLHELAEREPEAGHDDPLKQCYMALDAALGRMTAEADPAAPLAVVMGPGMEPDVTGNPLLPDILDALQGKKRKQSRNLVTRVGRALVGARFLPWSLRERIRAGKSRAGLAMRARSGLRYFSVPHNDNAGAVRINLEGREPTGIVSPAEYDELVERLCGQLLEIRDASGNEPLIAEIVKVRCDYSGPELDRLPDLLLTWNRAADVRAVSSPDIGTINNKYPGIRTGDHSTRGLLIANFPPGVPFSPPLDPMQAGSLLVDAAEANRRACV
jgi:predicted AlkP superfamily phosphohydrolase/phosphomutase